MGRYGIWFRGPVSNLSFHRWGGDLLKVTQLDWASVRLAWGGVFQPRSLGFPGLCPHLLFFLLQRFGAVLEALEKGQPVDLSAMLPAPEGQCGNGRGEPAQAGAGADQAPYPHLHLHLCSGSPRPEAPPTGFQGLHSTRRGTPSSRASAASDGP